MMNNDPKNPIQENELTHFELFQHEFELSLNDEVEEIHDAVDENMVQGEEATQLELNLEHHKKTLETISQQMKEFSLEPAREFKSDSDSFPSVLVDEQLLQDFKKIPDRFGFKIGDVADLLGIKQYVLRYWEQEFELLKPKKASNNQRFYTKKDVENAFLIKKLLYRDKFSIEGARQALKDVKFAVKKEKNKEKDFSAVIQRMDFIQDQIKNFVTEIQKTKKFFN